jgi:hypothetical protein
MLAPTKETQCREFKCGTTFILIINFYQFKKNYGRRKWNGKSFLDFLMGSDESFYELKFCDDNFEERYVGCKFWKSRENFPIIQLFNF